MTVKNLGWICALASFTLLAGCFFNQAPGEFQGGSNPVQAAGKIASDRLDTMNPDDVQVLAELVASQTGEDIPEVTDAQAAAVVQFISDNSIVSMDDLQSTIEQAAENPDSVVISEEVQAVLEALQESGDVQIDEDTLNEITG
jgi:K+-transporting ATPase c subunit